MDIAVDGSKIRELRLIKSWSQEQLADASGLHHRTIQRIETENRASPKSRQALANAFAISPNDLDIEPATTQEPLNRDPAQPLNKRANWVLRIFLATCFAIVFVIVYLVVMPYYLPPNTDAIQDPSIWNQLFIAGFPIFLLSFIMLVFPIPTILAWRKHHQFKWPITMINLVGTLFFSYGAGIIGFTSAWLVAFTWCFFESKPQERPI